MKQQTLSIVKPDATAANNVGAILSTFEQNGLTIVACKMTHLSVEKAQQFYAVHKDRPFFGELVDFMVSGPVVVSVLEGDNAIAKNRELMGATTPAAAADGTIRKRFATDIGRNAVHGSDAPETAAIEIAHFFSGLELCDNN